MRPLQKFNVGLCLAILSALAMADHVGMPGDMPKSFSVECESCHIPYAPGLMPAKSWQSLMGSLDGHYGTDASLDARTVKDISVWLDRHAATSRKFAEAAPNNRITKTAWFIKKHREIEANVWKRAAINSPANCAACHQQA